MTDTLEPIHTIPLGPTLTGEVSQAELQFALENGKPVLYAAVPVWNATWGRWFMWHAPEIMVGLWLAVLIVLVRRLLHVRRTPREKGRRYCRKCNHQLTKPQLAFDERGRVQWASAEAKCPECGVRTRRVPVRGRSGWVRRLPWLLVATPLILLLPLLFLGSIRAHLRVPGMSEPTWPIAGLQNILGSWALQRRVPSFVVQSFAYWRIDPADGSVRRYGGMPATGTPRTDRFASPGGTKLVLSSDGPDGLVVLDTATGTSRVLRHPKATWTSIGRLRLHRFLGEDRVLVQRDVYETEREVASLEAVDLVTGAFTTIVEMPFARSDGRVSVMREFESVGDAETLRWFVRCSSWDRTGVPSEEIVWRADSQMHTRVLSRRPQGVEEYSRLNRDGSAIVIIKTSGDNEAIDFETGRPIEKPGPDVLAWNQETSQSSVVPMSPGVANVWDLNDSSKTYQLKTSTAIGMGYSAPVSSADGRWIAGVGDRSVASRWHQILTGKAETLEGEIRIWRLPDSAAAPVSSPK
jgi:hypothetical protein